MSACLGLTATACTREETPAAPATTVAPGGGGPSSSSANSVPPGVSGQGSQGGEGEGSGANP